MDLNISGRTALVTGADSGIGYATARELLAEDATVVMTDLDADKPDAARHVLADHQPQNAATLQGRL